jgi:hypothetical protein
MSAGTMDTLKIYSSNRVTIYQLYAYTLLNSLFFIDLWARLYIKQKQISRLEFDRIGALVVIDRSHLFGSFTVSSRKNLLLLPLVAEHGAHESDRTKTHRDQTTKPRPWTYVTGAPSASKRGGGASARSRRTPPKAQKHSQIQAAAACGIDRSISP